MIRRLLYLYTTGFAKSVVYMLQSTEYKPQAYLVWLWRTRDFTTIMYRRALDVTSIARMLLASMLVGIYGQIILGVWLLIEGYYAVGALIIIGVPYVWAHFIIIPMIVGRIFVVVPREKRLSVQAEKIFDNFDGPKIAIAGSYGKTSMKEILTAVLGDGKRVAATPGNKNVMLSHARFAQNLSGEEDILLIEFGEGKPGDVAKFSRYIKPTHAIITGIAPAHLDQYKTVENAAVDIFSLGEMIDAKNVYANNESLEAKPFIEESFCTYSRSGALGWKVTNIKMDIHGMSFTLTKGRKQLKLQTRLVGRHMIGPLCLAAGLAYELGISEDKIESGIAKTEPYKHRMQPYPLNGAWIIDDTYNGNLEGIRAGTELLRELHAKRKWYVTPGLVDQGKETEIVHKEAGELLAKAQPDVVVLMQNSVTTYIQSGLETAGYEGELKIESHPLEFYSNLVNFVAAGDLVLMQNDWTDNYR